MYACITITHLHNVAAFITVIILVIILSDYINLCNMILSIYVRICYYCLWWSNRECFWMVNCCCHNWTRPFWFFFFLPRKYLSVVNVWKIWKNVIYSDGIGKIILWKLICCWEMWFKQCRVVCEFGYVTLCEQVW